MGSFALLVVGSCLGASLLMVLLHSFPFRCTLLSCRENCWGKCGAIWCTFWWKNGPRLGGLSKDWCEA